MGQLNVKAAPGLELCCPDTGTKVDDQKGAKVPDCGWWRSRISEGTAIELGTEKPKAEAKPPAKPKAEAKPAKSEGKSK